ncbi:hypothetical protein LCGC14_1183800 [marine sediment metagenome]|uniref:Uncharacterized protein n=1 Tax=marine sediment metagenome TaxID=412755 RepID=A0A0F9PRW5_9ZZZZ
MRKIYLVEVDKIDFSFLDKSSDTIQFTIFQQYPIISREIVMDIDTILKFRDSIEAMFKSRKKKAELRKARIMKERSKDNNKEEGD